MSLFKLRRDVCNQCVHSFGRIGFAIDMNKNLIDRFNLK